MPLTPTDVHDRQFKLVRQSTGYDMDEVDSFLDEVEFEIGRLTGELAAAQDEVLQLRDLLSQREGELTSLRTELEALRQQRQTASPQPAVVLERPSGPPSESNFLAAARLLELAQRTADECIQEATRQAEQIISEAQDRAATSLAGLADTKAHLEGQIGELEQMEISVRTRLREYLESQLHQLKSMNEQASALQND